MKTISIPNKSTKLIDGILYDRISKNSNNLFLKIDVEEMKRIFMEEHNPWYAEPEFAGQFVDIGIQEYRRTGDERFLERAQQVAEAMIAGQREDGYLGTYKRGYEFDESFSVWNQTFVIRGLVSYYELSGEKKALQSAERCADYIAGYYLAPNAPDILKTINQCIEHTCILEQIARLYRITGKKLYLDFANYIIDRWEATTIKFITIPTEWNHLLLETGALKAIESLICFHGIIEMYKVTGIERYFTAAKKYWEEVRKEQINIIGCGSFTELWVYHGGKPANLPIDVRPNETCVAFGWMKMSVLLYELTGEAQYIDAVEKTLYNHLLGAQAFDGSDFSYYQGLVGKKVHAKDPGQYSCCRYRGMAFLSYLSNYIVTYDDETIYINLFGKTETTFHVGGTEVKVVQDTEYPRDGTVIATIETDEELSANVCIRKPGWCETAGLKLDGKKVTAEERNGYLVLKGPWRAGVTTITLTLDMAVAVEAAVVDHDPSVGITYGPLVLAIDSHYGTPIHGTSVLSDGTSIELKRVDGNAGQNRYFPIVLFECEGEINGERQKVTLVDYASAGSTDKKNDRFKVWIPYLRQ